jgi:hypothetical protein
LGTCTEIHVETKGELENELAGYDYANIESLKITGVLNDVDFLFIYRMMPNLKNLDIAEVNITALPIQAFYKSTNVENLILPNTLITIGEEMFYQSKLKTVVIPANATTIGNSAFEQCASLISIDIPANVETIGTAVFWGCSSLTTVTFEKGSQLKTIGGGSSYYGEPVTPHLDWSRPIPWKRATEDEQRAIESVYYIHPITGEKRLDEKQMNYRYFRIRQYIVLITIFIKLIYQSQIFCSSHYLSFFILRPLLDFHKTTLKSQKL